MINVVVPIIQDVVTVFTGLVNGLTTAVNFIVGLPGMIVSALSTLGSTIAEFFSGLFTQLSSALATGFQKRGRLVHAAPRERRGRDVAGAALTPAPDATISVALSGREY
ncbi:hypothetical protein [Streptomyces sp. NPDC000229]|uniref:hypothetical protein n=1 Tax=Streptomyces sp. NPDC000229 TaxID=3154247 RepID=UPI00332DD8AE